MNIIQFSLGLCLNLRFTVLGSEVDGVEVTTDCFYRTALPQQDFVLTDLQNNRVLGAQWEFPEQEALCDYVYSDDKILQLGGNIGASCVAASRLVDAGNVVCVEPNPKVLPFLYKNRRDSASTFEIVEGVVGEAPCTTRINGCAGPNCWGTTTTSNGTLVGCTPLRDVQKKLGSISVLFADCEGCLPGFVSMYPTLISDPNLHTIIYEFDSDHSHYRGIESQLQTSGFELVQNSFIKVWVREDYTKGFYGSMFLFPDRNKLPPVIFINLDTSTSRQHQTQHRLQEAGLKYKRWTAVDRVAAKNKMSLNHIKLHDRMSKLEEHVKMGTVACYLSHMQVLDYLLKHRSRHDEPVMIMEDDMYFPEGWDAHFLGAWRNLPEDWDIFKPCYWGGSRDSELVNPFVAKAAIPGYMGTCGYIVRPRAIERVLRVLQTIAESSLDDIDVVLLASDLITYAPRRPIIHHDAGFSDRLLRTDVVQVSDARRLASAPAPSYAPALAPAPAPASAPSHAQALAQSRLLYLAPAPAPAPSYAPAYAPATRALDPSAKYKVQRMRRKSRGKIDRDDALQEPFMGSNTVGVVMGPNAVGLLIQFAAAFMVLFVGARVVRSQRRRARFATFEMERFMGEESLE